MSNRQLMRALRASAGALAVALLAILAIDVGRACASSAAEPQAPHPIEGGESATQNQPLIPAGQEELLADMLGRDATLAGDCRFQSGDANGSMVAATYACPAGEVVVELRHPSVAPAGAVRSEKFALDVRSGEAPPALLPALTERIRARESPFEWKWGKGALPGAAARADTVYPNPGVDRLDIAAIDIGWILLFLAAPVLVWRTGLAVGIRGGIALLAVAACVALSVAVLWPRADAPLHANGHAWREAREVLLPTQRLQNEQTLFIHGKGGISLQWLVARIERGLRGSANPFRISRIAAAAAAGGVALLTMVLVGSPWAGLGAGCVFALMPLSEMMALSGSVLVVAAWLLPWSLALWIAGARSGDAMLLAGAALATALGTLSHTAMLTWPPAVFVALLVIGRRNLWRRWAVRGALLLVALAWLAEVANSYAMVASRNAEGQSLLAGVQRGFFVNNLFTDPNWVSPLLVPLILLWVIAGLRRDRFAVMAGSLLACAVVAPTFFAVSTCSSDAVRYEGAVLGLATSLAVAGLWQTPFARWLGERGSAVVRATGLAALAVLPLSSKRQPADPMVVEQRLIEEGIRRMQPGTLVILPEGRFGDQIIPEFPDFLLPEGSQMVFAGDARIASHAQPQLLYLGLACISWERRVQWRFKRRDGNRAARHAPRVSGAARRCAALAGAHAEHGGAAPRAQRQACGRSTTSRRGFPSDSTRRRRDDRNGSAKMK
jgi:hypothetical protein